jgi:hypothetical protein
MYPAGFSHQRAKTRIQLEQPSPQGSWRQKECLRNIGKRYRLTLRHIEQFENGLEQLLVGRTLLGFPARTHWIGM